ncbi:ATP-binding protein [Endozoicomonas sp.]|uniref:ATP-binding protein n=1 Tax=Endozoicomonas sp. TaxID=1892382 RepID=UPI002883FAA5|nr:ATP-binding protein [Endozoicomonas sp.]
MSTSIRQKITLFNLLPALVFYCFITFVFLYFTFRAASAEIGLRHLNQTLHYASLINGNLSAVILAGKALSLSVDHYAYDDFTGKISSLFGDMALIKTVAVISFKNSGEGFIGVEESAYWQRSGQKFIASAESQHYSVPESFLLSIMDHPDYSHNWYVNIELAGTLDFYSSLLIKVSDDSGLVRFVRIDIDGSKLIDHPIKLDTRIRILIADQEGRVVFSNGISLPRYRTIDRFARLGPCQGAGEVFTPSEFSNPFEEFFFRPVKKPPDPEVPCRFLQDLLDHVVNKNELASVRILARDTYKWHTAVPIQSAGWFFSYSILESDIMKPVLKQAVLSASLIGLAMLLSIICLWLVSGRITRPLNELKDQMNTFGSLSDDSGLNYSDSKDEAVSLNRSFLRFKQRLFDREESLQQARASNMGSLVQQLRGSYFYFNLTCSGDITYVSPSIISVLGFSVEAFAGDVRKFLTSSTVNNPFLKVLNLSPKGLWQETFELEMYHNDGSVRCVEVSCAGHENRNVLSGVHNRHVVYSIEGMGNDITNRVRDTEKFKALIAGSPDAIVITDESGIITLVNERVVDLFRYHASDLLGLPLALLIDPVCRSELDLLKTLDSDNPENHCLNAIFSHGFDKYGHSFPIEISSNVLTSADSILIPVVFRDITERKQIESELLKAKETAEKASQAKSLFLSHMSHELRTPLNGVLGYAQLLLIDDDFPDRCRESLGCLEGCGLHLLTMINDILDMTKIESGAVTVDPVPFNLDATLDMVLANFREQIRAKGLNLTVTVHKDIQSEIIGDHVKIRQVLINLIGNAVKFTDSGYLALNIFLDNGRLQFEVIDSGPGMSPNEMEKLFQPFTKLKEGQEFGGAGLGLSICYRLVKAMGGELKVESDIGKGSGFYFSIPYRVSAVGSQNADTDSFSRYDHSVLTVNQCDKRKILVVDDSLTNRDMLVKALKSKSFHVDAAEGGVKAVEKCSNTRYDLILMDLHMPGLDGFDAARAIHSLAGQRPIKIMAISASVSEQTRMRIAEAGFCGFVAKPIRFDELFFSIHHHLEECDEQSLSPFLSASSVEEMILALSHTLEIGDLESLEVAAKSWLLQSGYGSYPANIIELCKSLDIQGLESICSSLIAVSNS